jgi:hypothetical protein
VVIVTVGQTVLLCDAQSDGISFSLRLDPPRRTPAHFPAA